MKHAFNMSDFISNTIKWLNFYASRAQRQTNGNSIHLKCIVEYKKFLTIINNKQSVNIKIVLNNIPPRHNNL